ncbi:hypothetical protein [Senimuribacter intestinalis]|uniref:hypothetical protein n=1 Tax=Senimuribacter intestinalis TaxID=2941507 RepID=UPI00203F1646|nr:hypothetical protein [Senimuribacter intestinalis]
MATERDLIELLASVRHTLPDNKALTFKTMYPQWESIADGAEIPAGNKCQHNDILWRCIKTHNKQENWEPSVNTASLWTAINEEHSGTYDDPIPVPEPLTSFEYAWGKHYIESDGIYLCNRQGGKEGDTYILAYKPSQLVGQYFEVA